MTYKTWRLIAIIFTFVTLFVCPQFVFAEPGIQINSTAESSDGSFLSKTTVKYIVTDPAGRKLGKDPRNNQKYNEFPGGYGTTAIDDQYSVEAIFVPVDGIYMVEVIGTAPMPFSLDISIYREIQSEGFTSFELDGVIDKGLTSKFQFTYNSDPSKPAGVAKRVATSSSLKQDITLSRKIGWIDNDGIMKSLLAKADAIESSIAKSNKTAAKNQLNAFINEVNAQKGKHISDKTIKILLEDAQYLLGSL